LTLCVFPSAVAFAHLRIESPAAGATVLGRQAVLSVRSCRDGAPADQLLLDGRELEARWSSTPYARIWEAPVALTGEGPHRLEVAGRCRGKAVRAAVTFESRTRGALEAGLGLARAYLGRHPVGKAEWDWGPAVFLYALGAYAESGPLAAEARAYLEAYHARWAARGLPALDRSDRVAPALSAVTLVRLGSGDAAAYFNALAGADYVRSEPRNRLGTIDHLGHSFLRVFYPNSIWVDSLMMYGVLAARWARVSGDSALLDFAAAQPLIFASVLQDPADGAFRHAWRVEAEKPVPESATYWLRGNGWVLVAIAEILDELDAGHPAREKLIASFARLAGALRAWQLPGGLWDSIANVPGYTHPETSGTALVAYALAKAVHRGWLDASHLDVARRAFAGVTARLERGGGSMPLISGPTNPGPRWTYAFVPPKRDLPYGVGPYLLAARELEAEEFP
jgi:unsaturated rhamnogalacturonyl hydrolase